MQVLHKKHPLEQDWSEGGNAKLRKETEYATRFRCAGGIGILREEVWVNAKNEVVKCNLAYLLPPPHVFAKDNGRVPGYDNAHGVHERQCQGSMEEVSFKNYLSTVARFYKEAASIRSSYENESVR
jgi:hypothetical protein